jgi:flavodoxin
MQMANKAVSTQRRDFLRLSAATAASVTLACSRSSGNASRTIADAGTAGRGSDASRSADATAGAEARGSPDARRKVLLVFFSRPGENYFHGGRKVLKVGNTEVVAGFIRDALGCDVFEIQPVEPYPERYEPTVERNLREQNENARPRIIDLPEAIADYDTIVIGSPIWNVRVPRIMLTFAEHFDFSGKTLYPFTTHAMSGLGHAVEEYEAACRSATIGNALAIQGETADKSRPAVEAWLRQARIGR